MSQLRPMLATPADYSKIVYPVICQPKFDGIRCLVNDQGHGMSRTLKMIPNKYLQLRLWAIQHDVSLVGSDGEILTYTDGKVDPLNVVMSKVMSEEGQFDFKYHMFDEYLMRGLPYVQRHDVLDKRLKLLRTVQPNHNLAVVPNHYAHDEAQMTKFEAERVSEGWEGIILRDPQGTYKYGRSTKNEGLLLKVKRFSDLEAEVIGFDELMHNENEATEDARGLTKRTSHKENKVPGGKLGSLKCRLPNGVEFDVGTGFDDEMRVMIWQNQRYFLGSLAKIKHKDFGVNGRPMFPVFLSWRHCDDVGKPAPAEQSHQKDLFDV